MQYITNVHDQNKDFLYGIGGTPNQVPTKLQASPPKNRRYVSASPHRRKSQLLTAREPTVNKSPTTHLDLTKGNTDTEISQRITTGASKLDSDASPTYNPKASTLIKLQEILSPIPIKGEQGDSFAQKVSKGATDVPSIKSLDPKTPKKFSKFKATSIPIPEEPLTPRSPTIRFDTSPTPIVKTELATSRVFDRDKSPSQVLKTDIATPRVFTNDKSPSKVLKTDNPVSVGKCHHAHVPAVDPNAYLASFRRKHLSTKPSQILRVEEMYAKYVESKNHLMSEFRESGKLSFEDAYKGLEVLKSHRKHPRKPSTEEIDQPPKLNLTPREVSIPERIQTHRRAQSVTKVRPPEKIKNIHMELLRSQKNISRLIRPKSKNPSAIVSDNQGTASETIFRAQRAVSLNRPVTTNSDQLQQQLPTENILNAHYEQIVHGGEQSPEQMFMVKAYSSTIKSTIS